MKILLLSAMALSAPLVFADELMLYTSQPNQDAQQTVDAFMQAHPEIEVKWVRDGTTKLMAKLQAELQSGVVNPDVLLIADAVTMESLKQNDRLQPYKSAEADYFNPSFYDKDGYYYGTKLINTGIVYNNRASEQPTSWQDLTTKNYENLVAMPSPLYSGAALIHVASLSSDESLGWEYVEKLAKNKASAQGGNGGVLKAVASGQKAYGVIVDFLAIREAKKGAPITFVYPTEGVSVVTEPVAIMKGSKNQAAAEKFVDFLLSNSGQELVSHMGYLPARNDVAAPADFPARDKIKFLPFEPQQALKQAQANKHKFAQIFAIQ